MVYLRLILDIVETISATISDRGGVCVATFRLLGCAESLRLLGLVGVGVLDIVRFGSAGSIGSAPVLSVGASLTSLTFLLTPCPSSSSAGSVADSSSHP